jgi:hypothetical protein
MYALKRLEQYMQSGATPAAAKELARLIEALRQEKEYPLAGLYEIDYQAFELAVEALRDWRVDRYYAGPGRPQARDTDETACAA